MKENDAYWNKFQLGFENCQGGTEKYQVEREKC